MSEEVAENNNQLTSLEQQAAALDSQVAADANPAPVAQIAGPRLDVVSKNATFQPLIRQVSGLVVVGLSKKWPQLREFYTPEAVAQAATSFVNLMNEYEIDLTKWLGEGGTKMQAWVDFGMSAVMPGLLFAIATNGQGEAPPQEQAVVPVAEG